MDEPCNGDSNRGLGRIAERFHRLIEDSPAIIWAYDEVNGRMIYLNRVIENVLGYDRTDFYAAPAFWFELIHPDDKGIVSKLNYILRNEVKTITYEVRYLAAKGDYVRLLTVVRPILDGRGHLVRTEGAAILVTDAVLN